MPPRWLLGSRADTIEFGRPIDRQRAVAPLLFAATNRRQAFTPFGMFVRGVLTDN